MAEKWGRHTLTAELLSDAHLGSGSGGGGIDALVARDRHGRPVVWASHVEGVLRDAARRLRGDDAASGFFGRAGGERQRAVFTSLYADADPGSHVWRSTARKAFDNRAPKGDTLRVVEYVPKGTKLSGQVELPESELLVLRRLIQEVNALGGGRANGAGRVKLTLAESTAKARTVGNTAGRLVLLLKNLDPLCITATATPDNLIPSLAFVPGRTLLGALAAWLIAEGDRDTASLLVGGRVAVSDALPVPHVPAKLEAAEVLPAPLSLQSAKPAGSSGNVPWWAQPKAATRRLDAWSAKEKLKRPEDDLFVYRASPSEPWTTFRPSRRVRLRNGRPDPTQADASLFAIEQIVEDTIFLCELRGSPEEMELLAEKLAPVLDGRRWFRVGRAGAPAEVTHLAWCGDPSPAQTSTTALLTLTSDMLVRDEHLRWCTAIDEAALRALPEWPADVRVSKSMQDSVMVHGFNGTSRLWRMPAAAIRRGSVFEVSGAGIATLAQMAASGKWLGERTYEGFGRFRIDPTLPGVTNSVSSSPESRSAADADEEAAAAKTREWFNAHDALAKPGSSSDRPPSLSQWLDLVADLERGEPKAIESRLNPATAGARSWKHNDAKAILEKLSSLTPLAARAAHARLFVRWLRPVLKAELRKGVALTTRLTLFTATLVQDSALSVSGLDRESSADQPFALVDGVPTLVGRGLKGAAVAMARRFFAPLPRAVSDEAARGTALHRSMWEFADATTTGVMRTRTGVGIRHATGARAGGVLDDREVIPAGTRWQLEFRVDWSYVQSADEGREAEGILGYVLAQHWAQGRCWLGGGAARGLGWCHVEGLQAHHFDEASYDRWIESGRTQLPPALNDVPVVEPTRPWCFRTLDVDLSFGEYRPDPEDSAWGLDMLAVGPHDTERAVQPTGDGSWAKPSWASDAETPPDIITDRAILMDGARPLLPGASIRGLLRHAFSRAERAAGRVVQDPHLVQGEVGAADAAGQAFGTVAKSSRILIRDGRAESGWGAAKLHMHAEDEFSAGSYGSGKRDAVRVLKGVFPIRIVIEGPEPREVEPLVALIDRQVALGALGHLPVGGHKTRGAGWGHWQPKAWRVDDVLKARSWTSPAEAETALRQTVRRTTGFIKRPAPTGAWVRTNHGSLDRAALTLGEAARLAQSALGAHDLVAWWCDPTLDLALTEPPATFGREWPLEKKLHVDEVAFYAERAVWRAVRTTCGARYILIEEVASNEAGARHANVVHTPARLHGFRRFSAAKTGQGNVLVREWHDGNEILGFTIAKEDG